MCRNFAPQEFFYMPLHVGLILRIKQLQLQFSVMLAPHSRRVKPSQGERESVDGALASPRRVSPRLAFAKTRTRLRSAPCRFLVSESKEANGEPERDPRYNNKKCRPVVLPTRPADRMRLLK
ncbi:hypothetical protein ANN_19307 [Periplaneta americana]|uniref:Uncharacterized protein n=1 Tax=Periplaneta americana TaxID=6978 RepID=A0ABQ8SAF8_PERAM|nr:hypothetical protein ANN_19307 [Periplaneta americana]